MARRASQRSSGWLRGKNYWYKRIFIYTNAPCVRVSLRVSPLSEKGERGNGKQTRKMGKKGKKGGGGGGEKSRKKKAGRCNFQSVEMEKVQCRVSPPFPSFLPLFFPSAHLFIYSRMNVSASCHSSAVSLCSARPALQIFIVIYSLLGADFLLPSPSTSPSRPAA